MNKRATRRPHLHFTPKAGWMNDPNGLVYFEDEYHLFFQYQTPRHWGHAVSRDLMQWEELPVALSPDHLGHIFSGSAVVDLSDSTGFFGGEKGVVAIYTNHLDTPNDSKSYVEVQSIAYSTNKGRDWTPYPSNPVLTSDNKLDFRDPMVLWHAETLQWIMILATRGSVSFFTSPNLKDWELTSELNVAEGDDRFIAECPDLFECEVEGRPGEKQWVLLMSWRTDLEERDEVSTTLPYLPQGEKYYVGHFDGKSFHPHSSSSKRVSTGDVYATVTWKGETTRKVGIGWMNHWGYAGLVPTSPWQGSMTIPREFRLREIGGDFNLIQLPVAELSQRRTSSRIVAPRSLRSNERYFEGENAEAFELEVSIGVGSAQSIVVDWIQEDDTLFRLLLDVPTKLLTLDRSRSGIVDFQPNFAEDIIGSVSLHDSTISLRLIFDAGSVEIFANEGEFYAARIVIPTSLPKGIAIEARGGTATLNAGAIHTYNRE